MLYCLNLTLCIYTNNYMFQLCMARAVQFYRNIYTKKENLSTIWCTENNYRLLDVLLYNTGIYLDEYTA